MDRLIFNKDANGEIKATIANSSIRNEKGSSLKINKYALEEAVKKSMCRKMLYEKSNVFNEWYVFNDMIILRISYMNRDEESYFLFDNAVNGKFIPVLFENNHIAHTKKKDKRETSRKTPIVGVKNVRFINKQGEIKVNADKSKEINMGTALWLVAYGVINDFNGNYICDVVNQEIHHKSYDFDNRIKNIELVSSERHKEIHKSISYRSHQLQVYINTFDELIAFINFIRKH